MPFKNRDEALAYRRAYYAANREKRKAHTKASDVRAHARDPLLHRVKRMHRDAKQRAIGSEMTFSIRFEWLLEEAKKADLIFRFELHASGKVSRNSMTLDRFDNTLGYVESNVRVIPFWMNKAKGDCSVDEIKTLLKYMEG